MESVASRSACCAISINASVNARNFGFPIRRNRRRFVGERLEDAAVALDRRAQTLDIVVRRVGAVFRFREHVFEHRVVVRGKLLHEGCRDDPARVEGFEKRTVLADHLFDRPAKGEGGRFEALQKTRAQQPDQRPDAALFVGSFQQPQIRRVARRT